MIVRWTRKGLSDLVRLHEFLAPVDRPAAARVVQALTSAVTRLEAHPRLGESLEQFEPREVRRLVVGHYELRYAIRETTVFVLRLWHTRESR